MPDLITIAAFVVAAGLVAFVLVYPIVKQKKRSQAFTERYDWGVGKCPHGLPEYHYCAECEEAKWRK